MSGTIALLLDSIKARANCPVCGRGVREGLGGPTTWFVDRAVFSCGAVFGVRDNAIVAAQACRDRSDLAAKLWTLEAKGEGPAISAEPAGPTSEAQIAELILALAVTATKGGIDPLTICEIIRDEMQSFADRKREGGA